MQYIRQDQWWIEGLFTGGSFRLSRPGYVGAVIWDEYGYGYGKRVRVKRYGLNGTGSSSTGVGY